MISYSSPRKWIHYWKPAYFSLFVLAVLKVLGRNFTLKLIWRTVEVQELRNQYLNGIHEMLNQINIINSDLSLPVLLGNKNSIYMDATCEKKISYLEKETSQLTIHTPHNSREHPQVDDSVNCTLWTSSKLKFCFLPFSHFLQRYIKQRSLKALWAPRG